MDTLEEIIGAVAKCTDCEQRRTIVHAFDVGVNSIILRCADCQAADEARLVPIRYQQRETPQGWICLERVEATGFVPGAVKHQSVKEDCEHWPYGSRLGTCVKCRKCLVDNVLGLYESLVWAKSPGADEGATGAIGYCLCCRADLDRRAAAIAPSGRIENMPPGRYIVSGHADDGVLSQDSHEANSYPSDINGLFFVKAVPYFACVTVSDGGWDEWLTVLPFDAVSMYCLDRCDMVVRGGMVFEDMGNNRVSDNRVGAIVVHDNAFSIDVVDGVLYLAGIRQGI